MIQLHPDYLLFQTQNGQIIPCSAEFVTVELIGEAASLLDPDLVRQAAAALLHYFKCDLGKTFVSVPEFSEALQKILQGFGLSVQSEPNPPRQATITLDLRQFASEITPGFELSFFPTLRRELRKRLSPSTQLLRFDGLRDCVKQLVGAKRWNLRCQQLSDQIVDYLRECLKTEPVAACSLLVR